MFPEVDVADVPWVTTDQMREVDRIMIQDLGIELIQMMENAGRNLADLAMGRFGPGSVSVLAGTGGNGGGAMVAARHLANRGVEVTVTVTDRDSVAAGAEAPIRSAATDGCRYRRDTAGGRSRARRADRILPFR